MDGIVPLKVRLNYRGMVNLDDPLARGDEKNKRHECHRCKKERGYR